MTEHVAYTLAGFLLGLAAYALVGLLWFLNFAWQNAVAG